MAELLKKCITVNFSLFEFWSGCTVVDVIWQSFLMCLITWMLNLFLFSFSKFAKIKSGFTPATKFLQQKDFPRKSLQLLSVRPRGGETKVHNHGKSQVHSSFIAIFSKFEILKCNFAINQKKVSARALYNVFFNFW